ncbi:MAG: AbrB/MazE/SpoVT family DNA-binding domain-containing protein [Lentisphaeria bacterium]|nr:AbrB/MazE/SpoVT family DNA-binding domain-containing protein [Lentisphaeria bacterium]
MFKTLTRHGNSLALVIERPILELLGAGIDTPFEVTTDGNALILTPVRDAARAERFRASLEKVGKKYAGSFEELAK